MNHVRIFRPEPKSGRDSYWVVLFRGTEEPDVHYADSPHEAELTNEQENALLEVLSGRPAVSPQAQSDEQSEPDNDPVGPEQMP
jgi:hypothetical protein